MDTPRPGYNDPKQADWDKQYKEILNQLNEKIKAYNEEAKAYNDSIGAIESKAILLKMHCGQMAMIHCLFLQELLVLK